MLSSNTFLNTHSLQFTQLFDLNKQKVLIRFFHLLKTISLFVVLLLYLPSSVNAQPKNSSEIRFYETSQSPSKMGANYIVFKVINNVAKGLIYVQNSDVFSCFQGTYNPTRKQLEKLTFADIELGSAKWEFTQSNESLSLREYPYSLKYTQISEGANQLFQECLTVFP